MSDNSNQSQERENLLSTVLNSVNDGIFILGSDYRFKYVNEALKRAGYNEAQTIGKTIYEILPPEEAKRYARYYRDVFESKKELKLNETYTNLEGERVWHSLHLSPVLGENNEVVNVVGITRDVTREYQVLEELKEAKEKAEVANHAKSSFLAIMSHEIRTPMGVVLGFIDILSQDSLSKVDREEALSVMRRNGDHLITLIDEILDYSKLEAGQLKIEPMPVHLHKHVEEVVQLMAHRANVKGLNLAFEGSEKVAKTVVTDPHRLRQILVNLIGNAIKFTEKGEIKVRLKKANYPDSDSVAIEVRDTGIGISPENRFNIFKPFSQADGSVSRKYGGTGLGLAISRKLAKALGGGLQLTGSTPGKGSQFVVTIKNDPLGTLQRPFDATSVGADPDEIKSQYSKELSGKNILVVEDNIDNQQLLHQILRSAGANVVVTAGGKGGIVAAGESTYDLVLLDIHLPDIDGLEAIEKIRNKGYKGPIIAITDLAVPTERTQCLEVGATDYFAKPFTRQKIITLVNQYLT